jgi:hypothetical protein
MSGAVAVRARGAARSTLVARVAGLYIAVVAGSIQLLDIIVDRLALSERLFFFAILLGVIGLPVAITATLLFDVAAADRRAPAARRASSSRPAQRDPPEPDRIEAESRIVASTAARVDPTSHVELALSYRRIAEAQRAAGALADAAASDAAFIREAGRVIAELQTLIDQSASRIDSAR